MLANLLFVKAILLMFLWLCMFGFTLFAAVRLTSSTQYSNRVYSFTHFCFLLCTVVVLMHGLYSGYFLFILMQIEAECNVGPSVEMLKVKHWTSPAHPALKLIFSDLGHSDNCWCILCASFFLSLPFLAAVKLLPSQGQIWHFWLKKTLFNSEIPLNFHHLYQPNSLFILNNPDSQWITLKVYYKTNLHRHHNINSFVVNLSTLVNSGQKIHKRIEF